MRSNSAEDFGSPKKYRTECNSGTHEFIISYGKDCFTVQYEEKLNILFI